MQTVFNKNGVFQPEILTRIDAEIDQIAAEQTWLDEHHGRPGCVNLSNFADTGWNRGRRHTEETRAKLRGRVHTTATRKYLSAIALGRALSDAHRKAIAMGHRGMRPTPQCIVAAAQANRDRVWTDEMRGRLADAHRGTRRSVGSIERQRETWRARPENAEKARSLAMENRIQKGAQKSEEACQKLSEAAMRRWASLAARQALSERARGRVWVTDGKTCKLVRPDEIKPYLVDSRSKKRGGVGSGWRLSCVHKI